MFSWTVLTRYDYSIRQVPFGPRFGLNYARTKINGYTEQGSTVLELAYGPYLISELKPLSKSNSPVPVHLFQDFTGVVPDHVSN